MVGMNLETLKNQWEVPGFIASISFGGAGMVFHSFESLTAGFLLMTVLFVMMLMEDKE